MDDKNLDNTVIPKIENGTIRCGGCERQILLHMEKCPSCGWSNFLSKISLEELNEIPDDQYEETVKKILANKQLDALKNEAQVGRKSYTPPVGHLNLFVLFGLFLCLSIFLPWGFLKLFGLNFGMALGILGIGFIMIGIGKAICLRLDKINEYLSVNSKS
jgi:hypothetical protein